MVQTLFKRLTSTFSANKAQSSNCAHVTAGRKTKRARHRYLTPLYNGYQIVKTTFQKIEYDQVKKSQYDPYQIQQLNQEYHYDPYSPNSTLLPPCTTQTDHDTVVINKRKADVLDEDNDEDEDNVQPVMKRLRSMAYTVAENAMYSVLYGALVTCDFLRETRQFGMTKILPTQQPNNSSLVEFFSVGSTAVVTKDDFVSCKRKKKMRGYGVDFSPLVERPPALQMRIEAAERNIRDVCKRSEQKVREDSHRHHLNKYSGGLPFKRRYDDRDWGIVDENDYSVQFMY
ncbi:hypothetical protein A0J61_01469 [Choanephora cucurbitarum]|uniref:Uncharacterized protein n=1 Tax=Choanephora cucurbitarum TaxID=101091 RepID=A0A1C7NMW3_9FUNG|nr:hypothetical protein A0J61_01469 [Choanephora cucurbitarum]